jgi:hypothetical protein
MSDRGWKKDFKAYSEANFAVMIMAIMPMSLLPFTNYNPAVFAYMLINLVIMVAFVEPFIRKMYSRRGDIRY